MDPTQLLLLLLQPLDPMPGVRGVPTPRLLKSVLPADTSAAGGCAASSTLQSLPGTGIVGGRRMFPMELLGSADHVLAQHLCAGKAEGAALPSKSLKLFGDTASAVTSCSPLRHQTFTKPVQARFLASMSCLGSAQTFSLLTKPWLCLSSPGLSRGDLSRVCCLGSGSIHALGCGSAAPNEAGGKR